MVLFNPLSVNPHKMVEHTQTIRWLLPTNCLSVFDHFVRLALIVLKKFIQNCLQNSKEKPEACTFIKKEMFFCGFCKIYKNSFTQNNFGRPLLDFIDFIEKKIVFALKVLPVLCRVLENPIYALT